MSENGFIDINHLSVHSPSLGLRKITPFCTHKTIFMSVLTDLIPVYNLVFNPYIPDSINCICGDTTVCSSTWSHSILHLTGCLIALYCLIAEWSLSAN